VSSFKSNSNQFDFKKNDIKSDWDRTDFRVRLNFTTTKFKCEVVEPDRLRRLRTGQNHLNLDPTPTPIPIVIPLFLFAGNADNEKPSEQDYKSPKFQFLLNFLKNEKIVHCISVCEL
jgi:hypothetical protein